MFRLLRIFIFSSVLVKILARYYSEIDNENEKEAEFLWNNYTSSFNKCYPELEKAKRKSIFLKNYQLVNELNNDYTRKGLDFRCEINRFADLTPEEFFSEFAKLKLSSASPPHKNLHTKGCGTIEASYSTIEKHSFGIDWREQGAVTEVIDQGNCGSCWAFSTTSAIEGQLFIKTGKLTELSTQNILDCIKTNISNGCDGGLMTDGFEWVKHNGIMAAQDYDYEFQSGECRFDKYKEIKHQLMGFKEIPIGSEIDLEDAVYNIGPIAAGIHASHPSLMFYQQGVWFESDCDPELIDHAILIVGIGRTAKGEEYWIIKNTWSKDWGESGYFRMLKNGMNLCGIASIASYPYF
jgi:cathepsin L